MRCLCQLVGILLDDEWEAEQEAREEVEVLFVKGRASMIKFDLHIHSSASRYKEGAGIVDASTIENAEVLLEKLNAAGVGLFSITDHNRFNSELYKRLDELILGDDYPAVQGIVAGVEFDVQLEAEMSKCHIITVFDAKNRPENYKRIHDIINLYKLNDPNEAYGKRDYENVLREIGLDVILIACQRSGLERHEGSHNSLSESTMEPEELLMAGYINALEFQRPNVEGILRDNLRKMPTNVMLVMGSDCHEWSAYPKHSSKQGNPLFQHSRANILPTFKGLLMAVTSPETRINQQENRNREYIRSIQFGEKTIPLVNGLIAIIGENGSGKSSLIKILNGDTSESFVKRIRDKNNICCTETDEAKRLFIKQGQIVEKFSQGNLFPTDNYIPVDHSFFRSSYTNYANGVLDYIKKHISAKDSLEMLSRETLGYNELINVSSYFVNFSVDNEFGIVYNPHDEHDKELNTLLKSVSSIRSDEYYSFYYREIDQVLNILRLIYKTVHEKNDAKQVETTVKNYIIASRIEYNKKIELASTSQQRDQSDFLDARNAFISCIVDAVRKNSERTCFPVLPQPISGCSKNPKHGFSFNSEATYHDKIVTDEFYSRMFTNGYRTIDALKGIDTYEDLKSAVYRCNSIEKIDEQFSRNLNTFLDCMCQTKNYIVDTSQYRETLGNTLGELSLAYFKYATEHETEKCIFMIDQPEDHISNNNISQSLLRYFNSIRAKKQVIIVTHNPLLVVNQDVDQVLFVKKIGDNVELTSGCLEYEDDTVSILDTVANNMDGGKDSIEKRLKVYGKENNFNNATV